MASNAQQFLSGNPRPDGDLSGAERGGPSDKYLHLVFLRAIIWGLIGLIYAPLFLGLSALFEHLGTGSASFIAAAALAGGAGAVLYSGREVALLGAGVGVSLGVLSLVATPEVVSFQHVASVAAAIAALIALHPAFPARCDRQVPARVLVGITTGAFCGAVLAIAEPLHPRPFSIFAVLAFLVSVNGVLYVASLGPLLALTGRLRLAFLPCNWVEALVTGSLAAFAAGSVWMMAGPFSGDSGALVQVTSAAIYRELPLALLGGIFGGSLAGGLLAAFRFPWVHEL